MKDDFKNGCDVKADVPDDQKGRHYDVFEEVAALAQVLTHVGLLKAIQEHVQFARARFGEYDTIDFVVVLLGYALSGEATLQSFYERLAPFADVFMALFGRHHLPSRSALSRFLAALDQGAVEALRTQFEEDLLHRTPPFPSPGGVWDRGGQHYVVVDVDGTKQAASPRALPHLPSRASRLIVGLIRSVLLGTRGASEGKWCAPAPRFCKRIRINSWARLGERAMATTAKNCNELSR